MATANLTAPSDIKNGALAARDLCLAIETLNKAAIEKSGEVDVVGVAELLKSSLEQHQDKTRDGFLLALAEFIALALDGCVVIPSRWEPLT